MSMLQSILGKLPESKCEEMAPWPFDTASSISNSGFPQKLRLIQYFADRGNFPRFIALQHVCESLDLGVP